MVLARHRGLRYDDLGRLVYGRSGNHVEERVYDGVHLGDVHVYGLDNAGFVDASMAMTMDSAGRLVTLDGPFTASEPGMVVDHAYDARGRLNALTEASLGAFSIGYDTSGRRTSLSRPGSAVTTYDYDDAGRLLGASTADAVGALVHEILTAYDARGLPETQTDAEGTHTYSHDANGRLLAVDHPAGAAFEDEEYTYDEGNRRTSTHRDPLLEVVYNAADQLVQDAEFTYGYDAEGRRISQTDRVTGDVIDYEYNALDQMTGLTDGDTVWTFAYDAMDLRVLVKSEDLGVETYGEAFVYDLNGTVRYGTGNLRHQRHHDGAIPGRLRLWRGAGADRRERGRRPCASGPLGEHRGLADKRRPGAGAALARCLWREQCDRYDGESVWLHRACGGPDGLGMGAGAVFSDQDGWLDK